MEIKLNHSDLSALLAKEAGISVSKAEAFTKALFDIIIEGLESDGIVKINGLGTFKITDVASRSSVNVNTGEKFEIKGHKKLSFIPADSLREDVNQPFAMFEPIEVDDTYTDDEPATNADDNEENEVVAIEQQEISVAENEEAEISNVVEGIAIKPEASVNEEASVENVKVEPVTDEVAEEPVTVQERPAEPVMVRVPKKASKVPVVEEKNKRSLKWGYVVLLILLIVAVVYFYPALTSVKENAPVTAAVTETPSSSFVKIEEKATQVTETDAVTAATAVDATTAATPQNKELSSGTDISSVTEVENIKSYEFVMIDELKALPLEDITLTDTGLYEITGEWAQHKVAAGETLTRIALKYYGDKKLWPYIVKHNTMSRPDNLRKGMVISIPKLEPQK